MRDPLPFLPPYCPRTPTPSPSCQGSKSATSLLLDNYGLFGRLPYELRREILIAAFGGRTLHVGLTFDHPLVRRPPAQVAEGEQAANKHCGLGSRLVPDVTQRQAWHWFGCVCHRRTGYSASEIEQREAEMKFSRTIEPCDDECLKGSLCSCELQEATPHSTECFIGIMGWLLACRQAYTDGVDILYGTSTFHFSDLDLLQNLPLLLPHQHLSRIKSVEMLLNFDIDHPNSRFVDGFKSLWDNPTGQDTPLHKLCAMIPKSFTHVQSLYISFQSWLQPSRRGAQDDVISEVESIILGPVEDMLRLLDPRSGKEFNVAIQTGAWRILLNKYNKLYGSRLKVETEDGLMRGRFWKSLDLCDSQKDDDLDKFGYWICGGWNDIEFLGPQDYWLLTNWGDTWTEVGTTF
ncbi:hypothetical protein N8I77_000162 [Diaporthe amygdali]|uniref:DUF7730 domain-containing protein n=1 Tax=Phomopsis amygdali TaxID=1214568 RepID=A0AAD9SLN7_PHOAM|nr:hypothetical protein N8I77_000162 [Diaporthe amygdali]